MAALRNSQLSRRKLALLALIRQLKANPEASGKLVSPADAWQLLATADRHDPDAVADILLYPSVGIWLTRALHYTRPDISAGKPWAEVEYLNLVAAAAAIRCKVACMIRVPVRHGVVSLPTVGHVRLPAEFPASTAELHYLEDGAHLQACDGRVSIGLQHGIPGSSFTPTKHHSSSSNGRTLAVTIEDHDPYREFGAPQTPSELEPADLAEWQKVLDEAWQVLTHQHPAFAEELVAGLRALVPISREREIVGASSAAAFGGIILSAPASAIGLAETLVHELQHSKLNALLSLIKLAEDDGRYRFYAPWREDPRPLTGILHGIYAFIAVVEFMLVQRHSASESDASDVEFTFARRRHQLRQTVDLLGSTRELTEQGRQLVAAVDQRLTRCEQVSVPNDVAQLVELITAGHRALWRLRFVQPDAAAVESLCDAWRSGAPAPNVATSQDQINPDEVPLPQCDLGREATLCLENPAHAAAGYADQIRSNSNDLEAWMGIGLAMHAQRRHSPAAALLQYPELTYTAYQQVREASDPLVFAEWITASS
jgi:HEXXH motif-containing protein